MVSRAGLREEIRAHRTDVRAGSVVNAAGKRVASMDGDTSAVVRTTTPSCCAGI
ncbi:hypothetical protein [Streptomyces sp. NPDC093225]|uniref:hypothetical protein n=1 Tax=Streptomyces sp. NPDC093225 TaxID=3366034 RepID=UPI0037FA6828